jgi:hypothetical protein
MIPPLYIEGYGVITPYPTLNDFPHGQPADLPKPDLSLLERSLRRGLSDVTRLFLHAAGHALSDADVDAETVHVVFASAFGELATADALLQQAFEDDSASPARFRNSVHNSAPGVFSIATRNMGASTAVAAGWNTVAMGVLEAIALLQAGEPRVLLVLAEEAVPASLSDDHSYPALGVALVLSTQLGERAPRAVLNWRGRVTDSAELNQLEDPFAGPNHPLGPALLLARALKKPGSTLVQLGQGPEPYCARLDVLDAIPVPSQSRAHTPAENVPA